MKNVLLIVAIPAVLLVAACGTVQKAPAVAQGGSSLYCWKGKLGTEGSSLVCNWQDSVSAACKATNATAIDRGSVGSGPTDAGRCANGQWLVQVTTR